MAFSFGGSIRTMPRRQCWADLADTSNESIHPGQFCALPLTEDSYRHVSEKDLEESAALSQRLLLDTKLDCSADGAGMQPPSNEALSNEAGSQNVASEASKTTKIPWRPPSLSEAALALRSVSSSNMNGMVRADVADGVVQRRRFPRKRRPSTQSGAKPSFGKRQKSMPTMVGSDALAALERVLDPTWCDERMKFAATRVRSRAGTPKSGGQAPLRSDARNDTATIAPEAVAAAAEVAARVAALPEATEEDWKRRTAKRHGAVASTKATPEYVAHAERRLQQGNADSSELVLIPRTPEPEDRGISKRKWEEEVRRWRAALRLAYPNAGATEGVQEEEDEASVGMEE